MMKMRILSRFITRHHLFKRIKQYKKLIAKCIHKRIWAVSRRRYRPVYPRGWLNYKDKKATESWLLRHYHFISRVILHWPTRLCVRSSRTKECLLSNAVFRFSTIRSLPQGLNIKSSTNLFFLFPILCSDGLLSKLMLTLFLIMLTPSLNNNKRKWKAFQFFQHLKLNRMTSF